ncbi:AAA family ATPase [Alteriqipengyuania flavescens]|uniref:AAA family ATPase n=1 Tax=Alteriqipengyuania flavescens TaxID=3053610 RepID=UPI0025B2ED8A|nr:toprim domain-containing protein [Alteriqipengyuania flavescens]WJY17654.1 AAA family ATPase [Alteriqipengyuania flavescens]WJY23597.1 AAA family ATPase [Alteriqipengyuania flavescens]
MSDESDSEFLHHTSCEACGSSDGNAVYSDGHTYCHVCQAYGAADGEEGHAPKSRKSAEGLIRGTAEAIPSRKLDNRVCEKFGYQVGEFRGQKCHIAPYYDAVGKAVAQKIRLPGKDFTVLGDLKKALPFFGQQLCRDGGKMIVLTEGEIDAMSVTQAMGLSWPAVSVPNGASGAKKAVSAGLSWLEKFDKVVFLFDEDAPGREAVEECVPLLSPGKAYIGSLPLKDASDMVKAGRSKELVDAVWGARLWTPDVLNDLDDSLLEAACEEQEWGLPWPWVTMTKATYGIQRSAVYGWGAGTGSGKTTLMKHLALTAIRPDLGEDHSDFMPMPAPRPVATILYEEPAKRTLKTLAGMAMAQRIHVPGTDYDKAQAREIMEGLRPLLKSVSLKGARNWETVKGTVRYLCNAEGVRDFIIDPMTALTATSDDERRALDGIMAEMADLAEDLDITIHIVCHLATPDGTSHEDGGRVQEKHFRGSRAIAFWSHYLVGLERNKQDRDCPTTIRGLKDRLTGDAVGPFIALEYDRETGLMVETDLPDGNGGTFKDETDDEI